MNPKGHAPVAEVNKPIYSLCSCKGWRSRRCKNMQPAIWIFLYGSHVHVLYLKAQFQHEEVYEVLHKISLEAVLKSGTIQNWKCLENLGAPVVPSPFLGEGSPTKRTTEKSWYAHANLSAGGPRIWVYFPFLVQRESVTGKS